MKKATRFIVIICAVILLGALLFPRKVFVRDGGSYGYAAVLYELIFWRSGEDLYPDATHGTSLHIFPCFDFYWPDK